MHIFDLKITGYPPVCTRYSQQLTTVFLFYALKPLPGLISGSKSGCGKIKFLQIRQLSVKKCYFVSINVKIGTKFPK